MDHYSDFKGFLAGQLLDAGAYGDDYYCSLVDRRWRDFIHWTKATSA
jgi:hypothetical protein